MKLLMLDSRTVAGLALIAATSLAQSQGFELRPGANATLVGNTFTIAAGGSFEVEIWMSGGAGIQINTYSVALAMDRTNGSGRDATCLDNKLGVTGYVNNLTAFDQDLSVNELRSAAVNTGGGNNYNYITGAARPFVSWSCFGVLGSYVTLTGDAIKIGTATISTAGLGVGVYGDGLDEAGLFLANQGDYSTTHNSPQNGASGWVSGNGTDSRRFGSQKYIVTTVPEPATLGVLTVGVAALFGRRRRRA